VGWAARPPLADAYVRDGFWRDDTLWQAFAATVTGRGERPAGIEGAARLTFAALAARAEAMAGGLAALGVGPRDAVALPLPNWWETGPILLPAARPRPLPVPIPSIHREREVSFIRRQSGAHAIFIPGRHRDCDHRALIAGLRSDLPRLAEVIVVRDDPASDMRALATLPGAPLTPQPGDPDA